MGLDGTGELGALVGGGGVSGSSVLLCLCIKNLLETFTNFYR